ncbi:MAG: hypothetical protein KF823_12545 [Xanthomonadales bacterium]|nr:hypothetical protein [Xanthomonadales bacterium]
MPGLGRRLLAVAALLAVLAGATFLTARWLLRPDNLARTLVAWVERELDATLVLDAPPGLRLVPRLQLTLEQVRVERAGQPLAAARELRLALPWSALWNGGLAVDSLLLRRPELDWQGLLALLRDLQPASPASPRRTSLPSIAVGLRVEDGVLSSGVAGNGGWRLDQVSLVTTPLRDGRTFRIDAGARLRGETTRTLSLSAAGRPQTGAEGLRLDELSIRLVVGAADGPLDQGVVVETSGALTLADGAIAAADLQLRVPAWPDGVPLPPGVQAGVPVGLTLVLPSGAESADLDLRQDGLALHARLHASELQQALGSLGQPLAALAAVRGHWRLDRLATGGVTIEGVELDIVPLPDTGPGSQTLGDD